MSFRNKCCENLVGKGKDAFNQYFVLFPRCFQFFPNKIPSSHEFCYLLVRYSRALAPACCALIKELSFSLSAPPAPIAPPAPSAVPATSPPPFLYIITTTTIIIIIIIIIIITINEVIIVHHVSGAADALPMTWYTCLFVSAQMLLSFVYFTSVLSNVVSYTNKPKARTLEVQKELQTLRTTE